MTDTGILGVKSWRQSRGISLESIATSTRLSIRQLAAIEEGEFNRLPGGIYNTSYIRQYARAIGFDESNLLSYYGEFCYPGLQKTHSEPPGLHASRWSRWFFVLPFSKT
jgi:cytoskeletal protein RodZ